jgi:UPF0755 protein
MLIVAGALVIVDQSPQDCSVFYVVGDDLFSTVDRAGAFKFTQITFALLDKIQRLKGRISTGEYAVHKGDTIIDVLIRMFTEQRVIRKFTIPPGWTVYKIIKKIQEDDLLFGEVSSLPAEGELMPDTYYYCFGDKKESIIKKARNQMRLVMASLQEDIEKCTASTGLSLNEILIMASIIEKETASDEERSIVSSVFHNRLRKKMRLESCPTVIYTVSNGQGTIHRDLTKDDLKSESKFNTYRNVGLPPTPICNPSKRSIIAAANPAQTEYLFFVAKPEGNGHNFSKTYDEHLKEVKLLRESRKNVMQ